jgi:hypothetical protein
VDDKEARAVLRVGAGATISEIEFDGTRLFGGQLVFGTVRRVSERASHRGHGGGFEVGERKAFWWTDCLLAALEGIKGTASLIYFRPCSIVDQIR